MPVARYSQIARKLQEARSALARPMRLPDEVKLAAEHRVARETIRRALRVLENRGAITRRRGVGTFLQPVRMASKGLVGQTIGLIPPWWATHDAQSFNAVVFDGISRWADEQRCSINVLHIQARIEDHAAWVQAVQERNLAGVLWVHPQLAQLPMVESSARYLPTVVLGRAYRGRGLHHVVPDYQQAAQLVDDCMVGHGHAKYAVVGKNFVEPYVQDWLSGIELAHRRRGARFQDETDFVEMRSFGTNVWPQVLLDGYCANAPDIRAFVFLTSSYIAPLIADERFRRRLETDLSIATIDYGLYPMKAYWPGREITHVTCDWGAMGRRTMGVLAQLVEGHEVPEVIVEPVGFHDGQTVYPCSGDRAGVGSET